MTSHLFLNFLIGINVFRMLPLIYMERYFSNIISKHNSMKKYKKENCLKFYLYCVIVLHPFAYFNTHSLLHKFKDNRAKHSLGCPFFSPSPKWGRAVQVCTALWRCLRFGSLCQPQAGGALRRMHRLTL